MATTVAPQRAATEKPTDAAFPVDAPDSPARVHPAYDRMSESWQRCRDLMGGTKAVRAAREKYLPKHPKEHVEDYERRLKLSVLYNGFARTIGAMVGLVTQRDVALGTDNPAVVVEHWENIDGKGTHGAVFARRLFRDGLITGHAGIFVDYPAIDQPETLSKADEAELGVRPYWVMYRAEDIRSWHFETVNGRQVLAHLVLRECYDVMVGRFGVGRVTEYRVYTREVVDGEAGVTYERFQEQERDGRKVLVRISEGRITNQTEIPFVWFIAGEMDVKGETTPPLLDLADLNIAHYQVASDRKHLMHLACVPVPVRIGYQQAATGDTQPIGANILIDVPVDGDFKWAEVSGTAFQPTGEELDRLERQMASLGLAFLQSETRAAETAEAKRIDTTAQNASLAAAARALQDAIEAALGFHGQYLNQEGGSATVNRDFERVIMASEMITALSQLEQAGQLSLETLLVVLQAGHVLPDDFDADEEIARILSGVRALMGSPAKAPGDESQDGGDGDGGVDGGQPGAGAGAAA